MTTPGQNEEEAIVYRGLSQSYYNSREFSVASQSLSEYNSSNMPCLPTTVRSHSLPFGLNDVARGPMTSIDHTECPIWVQPGDLNGLKGQLVRLLELSGGCLPLARVPVEYHKIYGKPLYGAEYGTKKLVNLIKKMGDTMAVGKKGNSKFVYLESWKAGPSAPPPSLVQHH